MRGLGVIGKKNYDVLIVDREGSEWLEYCIPKKCTYFAVEVRNTIPFVKSFSFFYNLIKCIARHGASSTALLSAIILELNPKVVITFIDNLKFMGKLQTIFPRVLVISVQNGVRDRGDHSFESYKDYLSFPHYFGFGKNEYELMKDKNCSVKKYFPIGSLKAGVFLSEFYQKTEDNKIRSICFVSQYRHKLLNSPILEYGELIKSFEMACRLLSEFSQKNNIGINVVMATESTNKHHQSELVFFQELFDCDNVVFHANKRAYMSSYQVGINSDLIIAFHSTLLFELFGTGKKVLLFGSVDQDLVDNFDCENSFNAMPDECLLNSWNYGEFEEKVSSLLEMDDSSFLDIAKTAKKYYMNFGDEYPHQIIYNAIQDKCTQR